MSTRHRPLYLVIALAWFAACSGRGSIPTNPIPQAVLPGSAPSAPNRNELPEPPVVKAVNGVARVALIVNDNKATGQPEFEFDGMANVAPTIDVKPGETFVMDVKDDLSKVIPPNVKPARGQALEEDINIHFHGLGSSPKKPGDDVLTVLAEPGQRLHYVVHVPANQEPGLYWYHPHVHTQTSFQVGASGMSGAIVIEGIEKHLPGLGKMKQRLIVVRATGKGGEDPTDDDAAGEGMGAMPTGTARPMNSNTSPCTTQDGLTVTLNDVSAPDITIAPGEKQFFRVVNATGHKTLKLAVDGEKLQLVAIDGFALDTYRGTPPTESEPYLIVPPAARVEFIVAGPRNGHAHFRTLCYNTGPNGDPDPPWLLARLVAPKGKASGGDFSSQPLTVGSPLPQNVYTTQLPPPAAKRTAIFSENQKPQFFINGQRFSMKSPPMFVVHVGTVEEWHIVNVTQEIHDFHIHQIHFVVEKINGVKVAHPFWADSVIIPHRYAEGNRDVPGTLDLLMDFRDPIIKGEFLFHCHILDHEDQGMMAKIEAI
jgi:suppressor of ftsI